MWYRLNKLIKPNGAIVLFGSEPFSSLLRISNLKNYNLTILNKELSAKIDKQNKAIPYYLAGGFLGGILLCLIVK